MYINRLPSRPLFFSSTPITLTFLSYSIFSSFPSPTLVPSFTSFLLPHLYIITNSPPSHHFPSPPPSHLSLPPFLFLTLSHLRPHLSFLYHSRPSFYTQYLFLCNTGLVLRQWSSSSGSTCSQLNLDLLSSVS